MYVPAEPLQYRMVVAVVPRKRLEAASLQTIPAGEADSESVTVPT